MSSNVSVIVLPTQTGEIEIIVTGAVDLLIDNDSQTTCWLCDQESGLGSFLNASEPTPIYFSHSRRGGCSVKVPVEHKNGLKLSLLHPGAVVKLRGKHGDVHVTARAGRLVCEALLETARLTVECNGDAHLQFDIVIAEEFKLRQMGGELIVEDLSAVTIDGQVLGGIFDVANGFAAGGWVVAANQSHEVGGHVRMRGDFRKLGTHRHHDAKLLVRNVLPPSPEVLMKMLCRAQRLADTKEEASRS